VRARDQTTRFPERGDEKAELASRITGCKTAIDHYLVEATNMKLRLSTLRAREEALKAKVGDLESLANSTETPAGVSRRRAEVSR